MKKLEGKITLITGASGGIGGATALLCAKESSSLCLVDKSQDQLIEMTNRCRALGAKVISIAADISDEEEVKNMSYQCIAAFKRVDILVNCAGYGKYGPFTDTSIEEWDKMWMVNVRGMVLVMQSIIPSMISYKNGHIVNISSQHGLKTSANASAYCASKYAVTGLTDALSVELWKFGIKVSLVCPGGVLTSFLDIPPDQKPKEFLETEEIAEVLLDVITAPGKACIKQLFVVPKDRPYTVLEIT